MSRYNKSTRETFFICRPFKNPNNPKAGYLKSFCIHVEQADRNTKKGGAAMRAEALRIAEKKLSLGGTPETELKSFLEAVWDPEGMYLKEQAAEGKTRTVSTIRQNIGYLRNWFFPWVEESGIKYLSEFNRFQAQAWRTWAFQRSQEKRRKYSSVNHTKSALNLSLDFAFVKGYVEVNPMVFIRNLKDPPRKKPTFTEDEIRKLIESPWPNQRTRIAFLLGVFTGARISEIRGIQWRHIDFKNKTISIVQQFQQAHNRGLCSTKTGRERKDIFLPDFILGELKLLGPKKKEAYILKADGRTFPLDSNILRDHLYRVMKESGIEKSGRTFHSLRHFYAAQLRASVGLDLASKLIGHSAVEMTEHYSKQITDSEKEKIKGIKILDFPVKEVAV